MGKKHKKHKSEKRSHRDGDEEKPHLKLVLKLGAEGKYDSDYAAHSPANPNDYSSDHVERSHKKKKRKKKSERHKHDDEEFSIKKKIRIVNPSNYSVQDVDDNVTDQMEESNVSVPDVTPETIDIQEEPVIETKILSASQKSVLEKVLSHLLIQLERKDPNDIFAWPVNDLIAPGYSTMIKEPMDFSTIRKKIQQHEYNSIIQFKSDFKLMTDNCCTYNRPDTIYYQAAKKLLSAGNKLTSKDRLWNLKKSLPYLSGLSSDSVSDILGIPPQVTKSSEESTMEVDDSAGDQIDLRAHADAISFTDHDDEETVAADTAQAAKQARDRLDKLCPKSKVGFLRIDDDGLTTLNFINPALGDNRSQVVDLGTITGSLSEGLAALPETKEDKRNKITPLHYLGYGPFSSFAPVYDSRLSNVTQADTDMLISTYGGKAEFMFAQSLQDFVADCDDNLLKMVDDLLDTLTHQKHSRTIEAIKKKQVETTTAPTTNTNENSEAKESRTATVNQGGIQSQLNEAGHLIKKLQQTQNDRLSKTPPIGQSNLQMPTAEENETASSIKETLSKLVSQTAPSEVVSTTAVRNAMGIQAELQR